MKLGLSYGAESCRAESPSRRELSTCMSRSSPRPEATAPDDTSITSIPGASQFGHLVDDRALMRVMSSIPSARVSTLLPIFITIRDALFTI